jgi:hypothetical protein
MFLNVQIYFVKKKSRFIPSLKNLIWDAMNLINSQNDKFIFESIVVFLKVFLGIVSKSRFKK